MNTPILLPEFKPKTEVPKPPQKKTKKKNKPAAFLPPIIPPPTLETSGKLEESLADTILYSSAQKAQIEAQLAPPSSSRQLKAPRKLSPIPEDERPQLFHEPLPAKKRPPAPSSSATTASAQKPQPPIYPSHLGSIVQPKSPILSTEYFLAAMTRTRSTLTIQPKGSLPVEYRHLVKVGRGGFADVYRADSSGHPEPVAVKITDIRSTQEDIPTLKKEYAFLVRVRGFPNFIQMHSAHLGVLRNSETHSSQEVSIFTLDLHERGSLEKYLAKISQLPPMAKLEICRKLIKQIATAIYSMHEDLKYAHRDIKEANVLVDSNGNAVMSDFGTTDELMDISSIAKAKGTPYFLAPEYFTDSHALNIKATDIWSLAIMIHKIMTNGQLLYGDAKAIKSIPQLGIAVRRYRRGPEPLDKTSIEHMVWGMTSSVPARRLTIRQVLDHPFLQQDIISDEAAQRIWQTQIFT
jgi:hypothetical protein